MTRYSDDQMIRCAAPGGTIPVNPGSKRLTRFNPGVVCPGFWVGFPMTRYPDDQMLRCAAPGGTIPVNPGSKGLTGFNPGTNPAVDPRQSALISGKKGFIYPLTNLPIYPLGLDHLPIPSGRLLPSQVFKDRLWMELPLLSTKY